jgi:hypothetical protein
MLRGPGHLVLGGPAAWEAEQARQRARWPVCPKCAKHRHDAGPDRWCRMCTFGALIDVDLSIPGLDPIGAFLAIPVIT